MSVTRLIGFGLALGVGVVGFDRTLARFGPRAGQSTMPVPAEARPVAPVARVSPADPPGLLPSAGESRLPMGRLSAAGELARHVHPPASGANSWTLSDARPVRIALAPERDARRRAYQVVQYRCGKPGLPTPEEFERLRALIPDARGL